MGLVINGQKIDDRILQQVEAEVRQTLQQQLQQVPANQAEVQVKDAARSRIIEHTLIRQNAEKSEETFTEEEIVGMATRMHSSRSPEAKEMTDEELEAYRPEAILQLKMMNQFKKLEAQLEKPTDESVAAYYEQYQARFMKPEEVKASHIVKHAKTEEEIAKAKEAIEAVDAELKTGKSFSEVASKQSDCPSKGGSLGWFPRGQMVPKFENVVFEMEVGSLSEPFLTEFGWHIAHVEERKAAEQVPFEEVKEHIEQELLGKSRETVFGTFVDGLRAEAEISEE